MPSFGPTAGDDGALGISAESDRSGLVGRNDSTAKPPAGTPGGSGVLGLTVVPGGAGVFGANNNARLGVGVQGNGPEVGVSGYSKKGVGARAQSDRGDGLQAFTHTESRNAIFAENDATEAPEPGGPPVGNAVLGITRVPTAAGVFGANNSEERGVGVQGNGPEAGVAGYSSAGVGVSANGHEAGASGFSEYGPGLRAHSAHGDGTESFAHDPDHNGILGLNDAKTRSLKRPYRLGDDANLTVEGARFDDRKRAPDIADEGIDIEDRKRYRDDARPPTGNGVYGYTDVPGGAGVCGAVSPDNHAGAGISGIGPIAGHFFGNVIVTGDIQLGGADYAEDFDLAGSVLAEPGTVMVLSEHGESLVESSAAYDSRVAGIVCGAGPFRPGVILDRRAGSAPRVPIALMGKVYCKVDAASGPIRAGDVLTTSDTPGHAMRAADQGRAFGAVIGKALGSMESGRGLIPVLVSLQ
jgi:hypothetical protein